MLINRQWQSVPGTNRVEIYPYLRKPDILSSNSAIIRTPEHILLIDYGALDEQSRDLNRVIICCRQEQPRPVVIFITHCHIDHTLQIGLNEPLRKLGDVFIAVQEEGAEILATGDAKRSMAEIYGQNYPAVPPDLLLLTAFDRESCRPRPVRLSPELELLLHTQKIHTDSERPLYKQTLALGPDDHLDLYYTPGHSPESTCLQIGHMLFIGDLLAAANPMVAGTSGWNRDLFIQSCRQVLWLLDRGEIRLCYPGHGSVMDTATTRNLLEKVLSEASRMGDLEEINRQRLYLTTEFAMELVHEAEEAFAAISGRLYYIAHCLEELDEKDSAARFRSLMDADGIDACLASFRQFAEELAQGKIIQIEFALKALRMIEKIKKLFDHEKMGNAIPKRLIRWIMRLMMEFISFAKGIINREEWITLDINEMIDETLQEVKDNPHQDASIIDVADQEEAFLDALAARIGHDPFMDAVNVTFTPTRGLPLVCIAAARFGDVLASLIELLAIRGADAITITTGMEKNSVVLCIGVAGESALISHIGPKKLQSFTRRFDLCGMELVPSGNAFRIRIPI